MFFIVDYVSFLLGTYDTGMEIKLIPLCKNTALRLPFEAPMNSPHY